MKSMLGIATILILVLVLGCSSDKAPTQPTSALPNIEGVWQGMLTYTAYYDSDSLDFEYVRTRLTFADSSWQYYHMLPNGDQMQWYYCNSTDSKYYVTANSLHLSDACMYQAIVDGRIMYGNEYDLELDGDRLVLRHTLYNPSSEAEVQQLVDLRRVTG